MTDVAAEIRFSELLKDAPRNWGRWGPDDELGGLNYMTSAEVLRGVAEVRDGRVFTLGARIGDPQGDPAFPGLNRPPPRRFNTRDRSSYTSGEAQPLPGGLEFSDDTVELGTHAATHFDALGHTWIDGQTYNGYTADVTIGGMQKASVLPLAEHGLVGRGVLIDLPAYKGKRFLDRDEPFTLADVLGAAEKQGVQLRKRDIPLFRTGSMGRFYEIGRDAYCTLPFREPGLEYSPEAVRWFDELEIPLFATDTISNEYTYSERTGFQGVLHVALMRNLGITMIEILWLEDLAADCARDGRYTFLFVGAPLKLVGGTGAFLNPVAIK